MSSTEFVEKILADAEAMTDSEISTAEPKQEKTEGEHSAGIADGNLKKLLALHGRYQAIDEALQAEIAGIVSSENPDTEQLKELAVGAIIIRHKKNLVSIAISGSIRGKFGLWDKFSIAVRKDWEVVWVERPVLNIVIVRGNSDDSFVAQSEDKPHLNS